MRLGATSFVYPAGWADNVERLAPVFDDIELLLFEGEPAWPSAAEWQRLAELKARHDATYSLHTPLSASLASADERRRRHGVEMVLRCLEAASGVAPENYVLHVYQGDRECDPAGPPGDLSAWRARAYQSLERLAASVPAPERLCVESLDYDIAELEPVVEELGLSWALDVGHDVRDGRCAADVLRPRLDRTRIVQWHGTDPASRDHRSLAHYPRGEGPALLRQLARAGFRGVLTLEVFRYRDLAESLHLVRSWASDVPAHGFSPKALSSALEPPGPCRGLA